MPDPSQAVPRWSHWVQDPAEGGLDALTKTLAAADGPADESGAWPAELWAALTRAGAARWSLPAGFGGSPCPRPLLLTRYARVAEGSLTAAFVLTQHDAAVRRLAGGSDRLAARQWLERVEKGVAFPTVGISQLTTSRRHGPHALRASERPGGGYVLDGAMPWVTAAERADVVVAGAATDDGRQMLIALPADRAGVEVRPPFPLAALQASRTAEIGCAGVVVADSEVIAGPVDDVTANPGAAGTGGLETSALALGQARAAVAALAAEAASRPDLGEPLEALAAAWSSAWQDLLDTAEGKADSPPAGAVRSGANGLVLRATQAYLTARKGSGFLRSEPAQRWARQALFFLVWSCPSPVASATIRDLAGVCDF